jgi:hypothetical protein
MLPVHSAENMVRLNAEGNSVRQVLVRLSLTKDPKAPNLQEEHKQQLQNDQLKSC